MFVLEECGYHDFHDPQCGFLLGRGTNMAVSVSRDVISYCVKNGSPIFACSLDAEVAFDAIQQPFYLINVLVFYQMFAGSYCIFGTINSLFRYDGTMF